MLLLLLGRGGVLAPSLGMRAITATLARHGHGWRLWWGELCVCGIYYRNGGEGTGPLIQSVAGEGSE